MVITYPTALFIGRLLSRVTFSEDHCTKCAADYALAARLSDALSAYIEVCARNPEYIQAARRADGTHDDAWKDLGDV